MEGKIKVFWGNDVEGVITFLNKQEAKEKIMELLETREIEKIEVYYKNKAS